MQKAALFIKSAEIINAVSAKQSPPKIDINAIKEVLFDNIKAQCNFGEITSDQILKQISDLFKKEKAKFCNGETQEKDDFNESNHMGVFFTEKKRIWLTQETALELFDKEIESCLKTLKNAGALVVIDNKHLSVQRMIKGNRIRFYEIDLSDYKGDFWCEKENATSCP